MGPVMLPSKKVGASEAGVSLSHPYQSGLLSRALREAEDLELDLALPLALPPGPEKGSAGGGGGGGGGLEDEELTNLNWLHESKDLLNSFGDPVLRSVSPVGGEPGDGGGGRRRESCLRAGVAGDDEDDDCGGDGAPPSPESAERRAAMYDARRNTDCKPPYSFSCLIFMAVEDAPAKRLPVKEIYSWILEHFPYFASAPTGWKNSVRHNLSLNKCFKKVDKDRSQSVGKGSLWCIDPEYRQNLIQALKKTPFHTHSQVFSASPASPQAFQSISSPQIWQSSPFYRKNGEVLLQVPQGVIQNGARISQGLFPGILPLPVSRTNIRSVFSVCRKRSDSEPSCDSPLVSSDPKEDHTYSTAQSDEGSDSSLPGNGGSDSDSDDKSKIKKEPSDWPIDSASCQLPHLKKRHHFLKSKLRLASDSLPLKKRRTEKPPESDDDEEMKEAAGSLLHLAGVRACLNNITNRTTKGQKEPSKN
ncbi:unnamed protein product [Merluccius merluccius]